MAEVLQFADYPADRWARLQAALAAKGLRATGDSGEIKSFGADVAYSYADGTLTLTVKKAPLLHRLVDFCDQLRTAIEGQP